MKYNILIIFFIAFTSCQQENKPKCDYISNYYQIIYRADFEYQIENYQKAFDLYQNAFNACEAINTPTYNEIGNFAEVCAVLGKNDLAIKFIKKQIERGYEIKWLQKDSIFENLFASEQGIKLISEYEQLRKNALSNLNLELREELKQMRVEDQRYRNENYKENIDKQNIIDKYNAERIIEIFNEFGYPDETVIGSFSVDRIPVGIGTMILHTSDSIRMNYFVPKLTEYVKRGTCPPLLLGNIIDQYHIYNGEPQRNGTYKNQDGGYSNMISNLKEVDSNRVSIGLPPLWMQERK